MKSLTQKFAAAFMLVAMLSTTMFTGCAKKGEEPTLPPQASMIADFSDFDDAQRTTDSTDTWTHAGVNVLVWNVVLYVNLAVPTAAFGEAFNHDAKYNRKTEHWIRSYDFNWAGKYTADLHGWIAEGEVNWEMHVSKDGGFQDVIWFSGESQIDRSNGNWTLNKDGNNPVNYIGINWTKGGNDTDVDIRFTNILASDANNGDYIDAGELKNDPDYDRFYNIYRAASSNMIEIKWHHLNQNGRVKDPAHFGDSNWHCWNEFHADMVCQ